MTVIIQLEKTGVKVTRDKSGEYEPIVNMFHNTTNC